MSYKDTDYTIMITLVCWPKWMNSGAETHLAGGVMSAFVSHRPLLLECPTLTIIGSTALRKGPQRFWLLCHDCRIDANVPNSSAWWGCECCNILCLTLTAIACSIQMVIEWGLNACWKQSLPKYPRSQRRTCYKSVVATCKQSEKKKKTKGHIQ